MAKKHPRSETARVFLMTHDDPLASFCDYGSSRKTLEKPSVSRLVMTLMTHMTYISISSEIM